MIFAASTAFCEESVLYDAQGKRDPFTPLVTTFTREASGLLGAESLEDIVVEGIVYDPPSGSIVIANGTVMREGEEVGPVKLLSIEAQGAQFSVNGVEGYRALYEEAKRKK